MAEHITRKGATNSALILNLLRSFLENIEIPVAGECIEQNEAGEEMDSTEFAGQKPETKEQEMPAGEPVKKEGNSKKVSIEKVIYNEHAEVKATIVYWSDGSKTIVRCAPEDTYSRELGLALCICKKSCGSGGFNNVFRRWVWEPVEDAGRKKRLPAALAVTDRAAVECVIFNDSSEIKATIVYWDDGVKTVVRCAPEDTYSRELGLALCICKRVYGSGAYNNVFRKWVYSDIQR